MATISSPGVGSGLDVNSIVTQLVAIERQPIVQLQSQASSLQTKLSAFGKLQSNLSALRDAASALTRPSTWTQTTGTSSDTAAVSVTTDANNLPGSYSIEVLSLARAQSNTSKTYAAATDLVGEGTIRIELGTWTNNGSTFHPQDRRHRDRRRGRAAGQVAGRSARHDQLRQRRHHRDRAHRCHRCALGVPLDGDRRRKRLQGLGHRHRRQQRRHQRPVGAGLRLIGGRRHDGTGPGRGQRVGADQQRAGQLDQQHAVEHRRRHDADAEEGNHRRGGGQYGPRQGSDQEEGRSLRHRLQRSQQGTGGAHQVRRRQQNRRHAAGRQRRGEPARRAARHAARQQRRIDDVHPPGRHRLRCQARRLDHAGQQQTRAMPWPTSAS